MVKTHNDYTFFQTDHHPLHKKPHGLTPLGQLPVPQSNFLKSYPVLKTIISVTVCTLNNLI